MAGKRFKDFVGLNLCIYDPCGTDKGGYGTGSNAIGYTWEATGTYFYDTYVDNRNTKPGMTLAQTPQITPLLNLHRNGMPGYGSWKQVRASQNHLSRYQRRNNIFTFIQEPGNTYQISTSQGVSTQIDQYGAIKRFIEPVAYDGNYPLVLIGGASTYNPQNNQQTMNTIELKASFGNETTFFGHDQINQHYNTIEQTDENYEELKDLYLDGALDGDSSPIDEFNLLTYSQCVWPKMENTFLNRTRARTFFVNEVYYEDRFTRQEENVPSGFLSPSVPFQSMWPLDVGENFGLKTTVEVATEDNWDLGASYPNRFLGYYQGGVGGGATDAGTLLGGYNTGDDTGEAGVIGNKRFAGCGVLMNSYAHLGRGLFSYYITGEIGGGATMTSGDANRGFGDGNLETLMNSISASCYYSRKHMLSRMGSIVHYAGMDIKEIRPHQPMASASWFSGEAHWDAAKQSAKHPAYDTYEQFSYDTRLAGKSYSIIPEFRISSHLQTYQTLGVTEELTNIFELSGAMSQNSTTADQPNFYKILSNSDFLKHFELIKNDHKDFVDPSILTLRCKAIKKLLPYDGFYPAQRTVQLSQQFYNSYKNHISMIFSGTSEGPTSEAPPNPVVAPLGDPTGPAIQAVLEPLFAPGVLFNSIKAGVACDWPIFQPAASASNRQFGNGCAAPYGTGETEANPGMFVGSSPNYLSGTEHGEWHFDQTLWGLPFAGIKGHSGMNYLITGSEYSRTNDDIQKLFTTAYSKRIPFEALVEPEVHLAGENLVLQEPHPFGLADQNFTSMWSGGGDNLYVKMMNNFLAEVPEFFLKDKNFTTITSLPSGDPAFGNAVSGTFYTMRVKMWRSMDKPNEVLETHWPNEFLSPPQDLQWRQGGRETLTMYSRSSAFGPPTYGGGHGVYGPSGSAPDGIGKTTFSGSDSFNGFNWPYTPPYYHGQAWCDLIFYASESKKYTLNEILNDAEKWPYYTRFWWPGENDALRDLFSSSGPQQLGPRQQFEDYRGPYQNYGQSPWSAAIQYLGGYRYSGLSDSTRLSRTGSDWGSLPLALNMAINQPIGYGPMAHPWTLNFNALQLNSSVNLFGKASERKNLLQQSKEKSRVVDALSVDAETRWVIQPKFETPILNFNKYTDLTENNCTAPDDFSANGWAAQTPRGMWHQYGETPQDAETGVFLQVDDIPKTWLKGALMICEDFNEETIMLSPSDFSLRPEMSSLAELCGFNKEPVKLGVPAQVKEISEAVVAVPFLEIEGNREFFTIPRVDIDSALSSIEREISPFLYSDGELPKVGNSIIHMTNMMRKFVFPPSMDFVTFSQIQPFAMYVFEFSHNLSSQDLTDIWQNLPPKIAKIMERDEAIVSHELLAHELLGGGAVIKEGLLDKNAKGPEIPSNIRWMIFKVKQRAATKYKDKIAKNAGTFASTANQLAFDHTFEKDVTLSQGLANTTYNWPYDFFSLVELVKLDAEVTFTNIDNDDKGGKTLAPITKKIMSEETPEADKPIQVSIGRGKKQ